MLHRGRARRTNKRRKLSAATIVRCVAPALLAVALLVQNYVAERHFHAIVATGAAHAQASVDVLNTPFVPTSDQHDNDCPLCQVLGLGATTDVPQGILVAEPARTAVRMPTPSDAKPLGFSRAGHQPRGPPASISII
jgi:hypothetical protein